MQHKRKTDGQHLWSYVAYERNKPHEQLTKKKKKKKKTDTDLVHLQDFSLLVVNLQLELCPHNLLYLLHAGLLGWYQGGKATILYVVCEEKAKITLTRK